MVFKYIIADPNEVLKMLTPAGLETNPIPG